MAGSGRRDSFLSSEPERVIDKIRRAQERSSSSEVESRVSELIDSLLMRYNDRDHEAVGRHLSAVKSALQRDIEGTIDLRFGGSVAKHTYVDGLSDLDSLVILDSCDLADRPPSEALAYLEARLKERFPGTAVRKGSVAITIHFSDVELQLVPVVSCRNKFKIADNEHDKWSLIDPQRFSETLTSANQSSGGKLVPVVKIAKFITNKLPRQQRVESYHLEALAVEVFGRYDGPHNTKAMLKHFFQESHKLVLSPIADLSGQSIHVDDYLGPEASLERRVVSDALARVGRRMGNADAASSFDEWEDILT